ncbi:hypothetical protein Dimus_037473, partial [Dionaea muscipula]
MSAAAVRLRHARHRCRWIVAAARAVVASRHAPRRSRSLSLSAILRAPCVALRARAATEEARRAVANPGCCCALLYGVGATAIASCARPHYYVVRFAVVRDRRAPLLDVARLLYAPSLQAVRDDARCPVRCVSTTPPPRRSRAYSCAVTQCIALRSVD